MILYLLVLETILCFYAWYCNLPNPPLWLFFDWLVREGTKDFCLSDFVLTFDWSITKKPSQVEHQDYGELYESIPA